LQQQQQQQQQQEQNPTEKSMCDISLWEIFAPVDLLSLWSYEKKLH